MTIEQLRGVYKTQPFAPFTLRLADGRSYRVDHPDFIAHHPNGRTLVVFKKEEAGGFEIIDLLLVVGLEVEGGTPSAAQRQ